MTEGEQLMNSLKTALQIISGAIDKSIAGGIFKTKVEIADVINAYGTIENVILSSKPNIPEPDTDTQVKQLDKKAE